ncbi:chaplin [Streptomyces huiliensis]|uniref:chaplin n=1 Tax=Streptomyces huiliensis TaxID=2876027 RepID=UPI001CBA83D1|nr:chaplin [Streptomyces huiliensis]MBZ4321704.1 chaplin [Streptomyces huiliensis]
MNSAKKAAFVLAAAGVAVGASVGTATAHDGATATGVAKGSPGVISGNNIQIPLDVPINICGNTVDILLGLLNPTFGNVCVVK